MSVTIVAAFFETNFIVLPITIFFFYITQKHWLHKQFKHASKNL